MLCDKLNHICEKVALILDKYEFNIKLDQIKKLAGKKDFKTAAKIAKGMDWRKIKDWATLSLIINIQEASGDNEEAKDIAILAYNRNLGGRRLVYKLTELFIKLGEFVDAEDLYKEYARMSQHDVNKYVLLYKLRKAQGAPIEKLIDILEEYKDHELDEKYLCELAELYSESGRVEDCLKECEEISLWFQEGKFVEKALKLKQKYAPLTGLQLKILENAGKKEVIDEDKQKEIEFAKAKEQARMQEDEIEAVFREHEELSEEYDEEDSEREFVDEDEAPEDQSLETDIEADGLAVDMVQNSIDAGGVHGALKSFIKKAFGTEEEPEEDNLDKYEAAEQELEELSKLPDEPNTETATIQDFESDAVFTDVSAEQSFEAQNGPLEAFAPKFLLKDGTLLPSSGGLAKAEENLKELIENAKKKIESDYEQVRREDEAERLQDQVCSQEVPVADYNIYDTQNIQAEIAKNLSDLMLQNPDEDLFRSVPFSRTETASLNGGSEAALGAMAANAANLVGTIATGALEASAEAVITASGHEEGVEAIVDEQIEGQMNLGDWMEAIQEEKYGKQNTKEFSKAELERLIEQQEKEKDEYEKLLAKMKKQAEDKGENFNETEARVDAEKQVMIQAVKTDLAIRTGKATAKLEAEVENAREAARITVMIEERAAREAERIEAEARMEAELAASKVIVHQNVFRDIFNEDEFEDDESTEQDVAEDQAVSEESDAAQQQTSELEVYNNDNQEEQEAYEDMINEFDQNSTGEDKYEIPENVKKYFKKYADMPGLEGQLAQYFEMSKEHIRSNTSESGNIIISGNRSSDKTNLAVSIIKALNTLYPEMPRKIAKTTGESINNKGIVKAMSKLKGTALIVEDAGVIEPKRISEMLSVMDRDTEGMIIIFEDADTEINVLLSVNPEISEKFNYRIVLKQYTVNELVEMAKKYAGKRQYAIDDNALLQLYLRIDRLHSQTDSVHLDQIKEIIDLAIVKAEKRSSRKFFGGAKKRRGERGDIYFLLESDFKD